MRPREIKVPPVAAIKPLTPELEEAFRGGASALMPEQAYNKYYLKNGKFGHDDGAFIITKAAMDELLIRANGDLNLIMKELGTKNWEGAIYRIDIDNPLNYNPRRVSKDMSGANEFHIEGADKTPGGQTEIAINQIQKVATKKDLSATKVITKEGVSLLPTPSSQPIIEPITQE